MNIFTGIAYAISSSASFLIDFGGFTFINLFLSKFYSMEGNLRVFIATAVARVLSSIVNFILNRNAVFKSDESVKKTAIRYYILVVCQGLTSYGLVYCVAEKLIGMNGGVGETVVKAVVDSTLFFVSFFIQKNWVFKKEEESK